MLNKCYVTMVRFFSKDLFDTGHHRVTLSECVYGSPRYTHMAHACDPVDSVETRPFSVCISDVCQAEVEMVKATRMEADSDRNDGKHW